ncbi:HDOD domain-containing protein [Massilia sp. AB1]|nr:HDOD domain-containing protein [Massilia sp. AB1]MBQ5964426.1 HDOD domain-containing protein [Massilia sp. ZL223]
MGNYQLSLEQAVARLKDLPALPLVVSELLASFDDPDVELGQLADKIAHDQALAAKTLRLANSSFYGLQSRVRTIGQAIQVLGFDSVRALVVGAGVIGGFEAGREKGFDYDGFWRHAIGTALCARALARHARTNPELGFVAGLLHDLGRLVLVTRFPEHYAEVLARRALRDCELLLAEREVLGIDHAQVGRALGQHWKIPEPICRAIANHHQPMHQDEGELPAVVHVANVIAHGLDLADQEDDQVPVLVQGAWDSLRLDDAALRAVFAETEAQFEETCQVLAARPGKE